MAQSIPESDVLVVGAGPAGLAAALALARAGVKTLVAAPKPTAERLAADTRTFAALGGSVDFLKVLGVFDVLLPHITKISAIRLIDARGGLVRAPEVLFEAHEADLDAFGYNISQAALGASLMAAAVTTDGLHWHETDAVATVSPSTDQVLVTTREGNTLAAHLIAAADGRASICRDAAGITTAAWQYPQAAVTCVFSHSRPHHAVSTEFHCANGPLTTVPMPDGRDGPSSSLVWVEAPTRAAALHAMPEQEFRAALMSGLQGLLGSVGAIGPRALFPLSGLEAATMAQRRIALIGEAGHVVPPIGAQGLNLGFRDAATLAECVLDMRGGDPGANAVLEEYARRRATDIWTRTRAIDLLNRSLLTSLLPIEAARGLTLHAMAASRTLRRLAMHQGLEPVGARPRMMQHQS